MKCIRSSLTTEQTGTNLNRIIVLLNAFGSRIAGVAVHRIQRRRRRTVAIGQRGRRGDGLDNDDVVVTGQLRSRSVQYGRSIRRRLHGQWQSWRRWFLVNGRAGRRRFLDRRGGEVVAILSSHTVDVGQTGVPLHGYPAKGNGVQCSYHTWIEWRQRDM